MFLSHKTQNLTLDDKRDGARLLRQTRLKSRNVNEREKNKLHAMQFIITWERNGSYLHMRASE